MVGGRGKGGVGAVEVVDGWEAVCAVGGVGGRVFDGAAAGTGGGGGPAEGLNVWDGVLGGGEGVRGGGGGGGEEGEAVLAGQWEVGALGRAAGDALQVKGGR